MAGANPIQSLCEETTCPICLGYFQDPVMTDCGHVFCQKCIAQHWAGGGEPSSDAIFCPQCREPCPEGSLRPVRPLANITEIAQRLSLQLARATEAVGVQMCEDHQEPLKLFCEDDQVLLCVVCDRSREHREHNVIPKKEAFEEHKETILDHLEFLRKEREEILSCKLEKENGSQNLLKEVEVERQKIVAEFKELHQYLEKIETFLLTKLESLDYDIKDVRNKIVATLSHEISSVDKLIKEMEEKHGQLEDEFLQDIKSVLQRCKREKFVKPNIPFPQLRKHIEYFSEIHSVLEHVVKKIEDTVLSELDAKKDIPLPKMLISSASLVKKDYYASKSAFYCWSSVLGVERINSGRHSWVVDVGQRRYWTVGVAKEDLRELNQFYLSPEKGVWAVGKLSLNSDDTHCAFPPPGIPLEQFWIPSNFKINNPSVSPTRIRVSLDYEQGSVTFSDADTHDLIYTFNNASFAGAKLCSWLSQGLMLL
uniref:Zinc finger protein RFP-like n=1 Tax=Pogona vitticeps TaxID=103695 RepID=A0A6J0VJQ1_9SAUR